MTARTDGGEQQFKLRGGKARGAKGGQGGKRYGIAAMPGFDGQAPQRLQPFAGERQVRVFAENPAAQADEAPRPLQGSQAIGPVQRSAILAG